MSANKNMNVLIVDDYNAVIGIIRNLLKEIGFRNVDDAANGSEALEKIKEKEYGLILSDWKMKPVNGLELLQAIRSSGKSYADVPFIMVTGINSTDNVIAAKEAGVSNYIIKPFNAETLKNKMAAVIGDF